MDDIAPVRIKLITGKTKTPWRNMEGVKALKRTCRKFERKWRKTKLQVDYYMYKDLLNKYTKKIKKSRQQYFSKIIAEKSNNFQVLFSTIDKLINPPRQIPIDLHSSVKCNEFVTYFTSKISIRDNISASSYGGYDHLSFAQHYFANTLSNFAQIQSCELQDVVHQLSSSTCALDAMPTKMF